jgi:hypothetical protein
MLVANFVPNPGRRLKFSILTQLMIRLKKLLQVNPVDSPVSPQPVCNSGIWAYNVTMKAGSATGSTLGSRERY